MEEEEISRVLTLHSSTFPSSQHLLNFFSTSAQHGLDQQPNQQLQHQQLMSKNQCNFSRGGREAGSCCSGGTLLRHWRLSGAAVPLPAVPSPTLPPLCLTSPRSDTPPPLPPAPSPSPTVRPHSGCFPFNAATELQLQSTPLGQSGALLLDGDLLHQRMV